MILVVNTGFSELNHLAAELADREMLSVYVRPYANLHRPWERGLELVPGVGRIYRRTIGRRTLPAPLRNVHIIEAGLVWDYLMAMHARLPRSVFPFKRARDSLIYARTNGVARAAASRLDKERAVVASWGCAEPVFRKMKGRKGVCILNYPLAHHRFTRNYLLEEERRTPAFAKTLNSHDWPAWYEERLDREIELADHILVGSSFVRDTFIGEGVPPEKIEVVPYGVDSEAFASVVRSDASTNRVEAIFVGQIGQRKGISYLLDAAKRLEGSDILWTLVGRIQGSAEPLSSYRSLFRHIPYVSRNELREILGRGDLFVFPTLVEGMPLVVLEAMASGLPVVTTPNGPGDIVRDGVDGFLVPPRDVDALVDRVGELAADPELRTKMGSNARRRAEEYSWQAYRQKVAKKLQEWME
jgi:glycosyltransferase involved in cell wall biosynthesis